MPMRIEHSKKSKTPVRAAERDTVYIERETTMHMVRYTYTWYGSGTWFGCTVSDWKMLGELNANRS